MTFDQLEPSANAPWTSTIVGLVEAAGAAGAAWAARVLPRLVTIRAVTRILVVFDIYALLRDLKAARSSVTNVSGCSHAAKWPPFSTLLSYTSLGYAFSVQ